MKAIELLQAAMKTAHEWLEGTMADVTPEMAQWQPPGAAHPIGSLYAHTIVAEDILVNAVFRGGTPLFAGAWSGKTGLDQPQVAFNRTLEQAREMQVDLEALRAYAQSVYFATDEYLGTLEDTALDRTVDFSQYGMGLVPLGAALANMVVAHSHDLMGEISAIKGVQGHKGYPF